MITTKQIQDVILSQRKFFEQKLPGIQREIDFDKQTKTKQITAIAGIRRCGKSTLLKQFSLCYSNYYYINFDDDRLTGFDVKDFAAMMDVFRNMYSANTLFIDEIQNVPEWEKFVRRVYDEGLKVFLTGSNSQLLKSDLATHLTGRYFSVELFPFSFAEYLMAIRVNVENITASMHKIVHSLENYMNNGGFPEFILSEDIEHLQRLYDDVLYKDILTKHKIREVKSFKQLALYLFSNVGKEASYLNITKILGFKNVMSVKNYISYMQDSYLLFELFKYDFSLKKQYVSNKKIYSIDNGLRNATAFTISEDIGRLLENLVFIELKRRGKEIYYFKKQHECDFVIKEKNKIVTAIQVVKMLTAENENRELMGIVEAADTLRTTNLLILTMEQEKIWKIKKRTIKVIPVWKWLLAS